MTRSWITQYTLILMILWRVHWSDSIDSCYRLKYLNTSWPSCDPLEVRQIASVSVYIYIYIYISDICPKNMWIIKSSVKEGMDYPTFALSTKLLGIFLDIRKTHKQENYLRFFDCCHSTAVEPHNFSHFRQKACYMQHSAKWNRGE